MSQDIRSVLREMEKLIVVEDENKILKPAIKYIENFDQEREFESSIKVLEKLADYYNKRNNDTVIEKINSHILFRAILLNDVEKSNELKKILEKSNSPISILGKLILEKKLDSDETKFILSSIEKETIFGRHERIENLPLLEFDSEDEALNLIQDIFEDGKYTITLVQNKTLLHNTLNLNIGPSYDVSIVEKHRVLKYK